MKTILGPNGQLGRAFAGYGFLCDITNYADLQRINQDTTIIINCAAYTDVDGCETNFDKSYSVNVTGVINLVRLCQERNIKLVHFSSDYVFNGNSNVPYIESDLPSPLSNYGAHKWAAERRIKELGSNYLIIRTSMLYGPAGRNFVNWVIKTKEPGCIVDHITKITHVNTVVEATLELLRQNEEGVFHVADDGETTPYEVASFIKDHLKGKAKPVLARTLNRPAERPKYSVLDTSKIKYKGIKHWKENLEEYLECQV